MADFSEQIERAANEPAAATTDGRSATAVTIPDLIAADIHESNKTAAAATNENGARRSAWRGIGPAIGKCRGGHQ